MNSYTFTVRFWRTKSRDASLLMTKSIAATDMLNAYLLARGECMERFKYWQITRMEEARSAIIRDKIR